MTHIPASTSQSKISSADEVRPVQSLSPSEDVRGVLTDVESLPLLRGRWRFLGVEGRKAS
ncbi:MAG: hypothetical protein IPJ34_18985 [Myxococcales bacterium]|nr:hypothetical protein [Myxococcales bacterium]